MGNAATIRRFNFEYVQKSFKDNVFILINTLPQDKQRILIRGTLTTDDEVLLLNKALNDGDQIKIILYGENSCDDSILSKYNQLSQLGFDDVSVYPGGLFEWLLLQDIYGSELFPTTNYESDLLKFKGPSGMNK